MNIINELPITIFFNDVEIATCYMDGDNLKSYVKGYLLLNYYVDQFDDIEEILVDTDKWLVHVSGVEKDNAWLRNRYITPGCAVSTKYILTGDAVVLHPYSELVVGKNEIVLPSGLNFMEQVYKVAGIVKSLSELEYVSTDQVITVEHVSHLKRINVKGIECKGKITTKALELAEYLKIYVSTDFSEDSANVSREK